MEPLAVDIEKMIFGYLDKVKRLLSSDVWENILLDCSKNELYVMAFLYQHGEVHMSQIADYLEVPLNTVTGIITRMEKRELLSRERSDTDKRVVTVAMTERGQDQMQLILEQMRHYGQAVLQALTAEEFQVLMKLADRAIQILEQEQTDTGRSAQESSRVKKIVVE